MHPGTDASGAALSLSNGAVLSTLVRQPDRFQFVNVSEPAEIRNAKNQRIVRRHVKKSAAQTPRGRRKPVSYTFDLAQSESADAQLPVVAETSKVEHQLHRYNQSRIPIEVALGSELGVQLEIPVEITPRIAELTNFLYRDAVTNYRPYFRSWIAIAVTDPYAFYVTLSNAAVRLSATRTAGPDEFAPENSEALEYYTRSVQAVQVRLEKDPLDASLLAAVIGFACRDVDTGNFARSRTHLLGLSQLLNARGTSHSTMQESFQRSIFEVDVRGSLWQDLPPLFPPPAALFRDLENPSYATIGPQLSAALQTWKATSPYDVSLHDAIIRTAVFANLVNARSANVHFWTDDRLTYVMFLVLHAILSLDRDGFQQNGETISMIRETIRLALVVFLGLVKDKAAIPGCVGFDFYHDRVKVRLRDQSVDWAPILNLRLWALVVCAAGQSRQDPETDWYADELSSTMLSLDLTSWASAMERVRGLIWIESVASHGIQALGMEVDRRLGRETRICHM